MKYETIKKVDVEISKNVFVKQLGVATGEIKIPDGKIILNPEKFEEVFRNGLRWKEYNENIQKINQLKIRIADLTDDGKDTAKLTVELKERENAQKQYLTKIGGKAPAMPDPFIRTMIFAATGTRLIAVDRYEGIYKALTECTGSVESVRSAKKAIVSRLADLIPSGTEYLKEGFKICLSDKQTVSLWKLATSYSLKWGKKGIALSYLDKIKIVQQVLLEVIREAFKLTVASREKKDTAITSL